MLKIALRATLSLALFFGATMQGSIQAADADAAGDWIGKLETPQGAMRLWFTIRRSAEGDLTAVMESIDQALGQKIPVSRVSATEGSLAMEIAAIGGRYAGTWNADSEEWNGTFSQGLKFPLSLKRGKPAARPVIDGLDGEWGATFNRGETRYEVRLKVRTDEGGTGASIDLLSVPAMGVPVAQLKKEGEKVSFAVPAAAVTFEGALQTAEGTISGLWTRQGREPLDVVFKRGAKTKPVSLKRPQNPRAPLPYESDEVTVDVAGTDVRLAGTLTKPKGAGPFPAAILISGSGPSDRDESFMGHKPFLVLSDHLTRQGIAVLRYDDRGVGGSTGDFTAATSQDFAVDAVAAYRFLAARDDIKASAIGYIGHSEGGLIAPIAFKKAVGPAYAILLAGPGVPTPDLMLAQAELTDKARGRPAAETGQRLRLVSALIDTVRTTEDEAVLEDALDEMLTDQHLMLLGAAPTQKEPVKQQFLAPWYRYFVRYDPADYVPLMTVPVLAIGGSLDIQVPSDDNLAGLQQLLSNNPDATVKLLPGLNHLFQKAETGSLAEYRTIETTMEPEVLTLISGWIKARF